MADACEPVTPIGRIIKAHRMYYLAPIQLATNLDNALFGVLCVAVWTYFSTFKQNRKLIEALVGTLFALNIAQTVSAIAFGIQTFIVFNGNWDIFSLSYVIAIQTVESLAVCLAQLFFLERVYKLSKSLVLVGLLLPLIVGGVALGLANASLTGVLPGSSSPDGVDFAAIHTLIKVTKSWKATTFATDLLLTSSIIYLLHRSRNGWRRTNKIVSSLIYFTCEAQILPLLAAMYFLIAYVHDPGGNIWFLGSFAEAKVASLSVLHVLNSRTHIRRDLNATEPTELPSLRSLNSHSGGLRLSLAKIPTATAGVGGVVEQVKGSSSLKGGSSASDPSPTDRLEWEQQRWRVGQGGDETGMVEKWDQP